ncbi:hypothetical protein Ocin01_08750 [Orchesella cincta]|uniref:Uncharacterized protein n=1 Tax=Orchesella cincta TaxID=48709 RepID=A0A1D2MY05_ORCCI|nr:hypothetical protein Ocin01_08750 [Orchesella cincta]
MTPQPILAITQTDNDFYERLEMMKKMEELYLTTTVIPKNFKIVMSRLINLTTLNATFKNQRYQKDGVYENVWSSEKVTGRPLSDLKGLRKLVLKGKNKFTDIGIAYGLAFQELKCCHLPYSDYVTSWGIERFNVMNPSLESFVFVESSEHVSGIDNFSLVLATPETVKALLASVTEKVQTAYRACTYAVAYNYEVEAVDRHIPEMSSQVSLNHLLSCVEKCG